MAKDGQEIRERSLNAGLKTASTEPIPRAARLALLGILGVSLVLHLFHLYAILTTRYYRLPLVEETDMRAFLDWSDSILAGDVLQREAFHPDFQWMRKIAPLETWYGWWGGRAIFQQEPLYVYALSLVRWICGRSLWIPLLIQLLVGSLQPLVSFLLARRLFDSRVGLAAAAISALYGPFIFYQGVMLRDWLPPLMEPMALLLLLRAERSGKSMVSLAAGLWLAACALTKSLILLFLPFALAWLAWRRRMEKGGLWRVPTLVIAGFALGLAPLMIRNELVGAPVFSIHNRTAEVLIQGNAADARPLGGLAWPPSIGAIMTKSQGRLSEVIVEIFHGYQGRWADFVRLQLLKLRGTFEPLDIPNNVSFDHGRQISPALRLTFGFGLAAAGGLAGLIAAIRRRGPHLLMLTYLVTQTVSLMAATVIGRYRLALAAVLLVYAAAALVQFWNGLKSWQARPVLSRAGLLAAMAVLEFVLIPVPYLRTQPGYEFYEPAYVFSATLAVSEERFQDALNEAQRAAVWAPRFPSAAALAKVLERDTHHIWARALLKNGDVAEALRQARLAAQVHLPLPQFDDIHFHLGELFMQLNSPTEAAAQLRLYLQKQPNGSLAGKARDLLDQLGRR